MARTDLLLYTSMEEEGGLKFFASKDDQLVEIITILELFSQELGLWIVVSNSNVT